MPKVKVWSTSSSPFAFVLQGVSGITEAAKQKASDLGSIPQLEIDKVGISENAGILRALKTAGTCYCVELYDACIVFASIAAECVLNWDDRLQAEKSNNEPHHWLDVNNKNMKSALGKGLPVEELLYDGETVNDLDRSWKDPVRFVKLRNKYVHGEYAEVSNIGYATGFHEFKAKEDLTQKPKFPSFIYVSDSDALEQFKRANNFITRWAAKAPDIVIP